MKKEEYIKTIYYNGIEIKLGIDDYGQSYFIEYVDKNTKELTQESIGTYIFSYMDYIEYRFGVPKINCPIYSKVKVTKTKCCDKQNKGFCCNCDKRFNKKRAFLIKKRQEKLAKWFKKHEKNIT